SCTDDATVVGHVDKGDRGIGGGNLAPLRRCRDSAPEQLPFPRAHNEAPGVARKRQSVDRLSVGDGLGDRLPCVGVIEREQAIIMCERDHLSVRRDGDRTNLGRRRRNAAFESHPTHVQHGDHRNVEARRGRTGAVARCADVGNRAGVRLERAEARLVHVEFPEREERVARIGVAKVRRPDQILGRLQVSADPQEPPAFHVRACELIDET
ncbi:MAG: hypothetical protein ACK56I_09375, partial [bacterium]